MGRFPEWAPTALAVAGGATALVALAKLQNRPKSCENSHTPLKEAAAHVLGGSTHHVAPKQAEKKIDPKSVGVSEHAAGVRKSAKKISDDQYQAAEGLSKFLAFKNEYQTQFMARPDVGEAELVKVTDWRLLTPEDYDRTCFHIEIDVAGTNMEHLVNGSQVKALSVYATMTLTGYMSSLRRWA
jgi:sulfite reductase alpha subunit-like flavoprotein